MEAIHEFLSRSSLAVVGASRSGNELGNMALRQLKAKGYRVYPVHPKAQALDEDRGCKSLAELAGTVKAVLISVPPGQTERVVREAAAARIRLVWMRQGAKSETDIRFCEENGITHVERECILTLAQPVGTLHRIHR
jgi:predicted CoA-binding protein